MRLSDAIATGRVLLKPVRSSLFSGEDYGCALGMALMSAGTRNVIKLKSLWPILGESFEIPCLCFKVRTVPMDLIVTHIFDNHVFLREDWTLDQLIDWVRSVEPAEEEPVSVTQVQDETIVEVGV